MHFFIFFFGNKKNLPYLCTPKIGIEFIITFKHITIMSEIESKVRDIIVDKLGVDAAEVTAEKSFTGDLGADSLDTVELIMNLETEFGIQIPDDDAEKIATVGDAVAYIEAHQ